MKKGRIFEMECREYSEVCSLSPEFSITSDRNGYSFLGKEKYLKVVEGLRAGISSDGVDGIMLVAEHIAKKEGLDVALFFSEGIPRHSVFILD